MNRQHCDVAVDRDGLREERVVKTLVVPPYLYCPTEGILSSLPSRVPDRIHSGNFANLIKTGSESSNVHVLPGFVECLNRCVLRVGIMLKVVEDDLGLGRLRTRRYMCHSIRLPNDAVSDLCCFRRSFHWQLALMWWVPISSFNACHHHLLVSFSPLLQSWQ